MLLTNSFTVDAPLDRVWAYFLDVPSLAPCLPGAELVSDDGEGTYQGRVVAALGPVKLRFGGTARIVEADEAAHRMVLRAAGSEERGRGTAEMTITARLTATGSGTRVDTEQDLTISGAAANFGRGLIADVTSVLLDQFAACVQANLDAGGGGTATAVRAAPASGFAIGVRAAVLALKRVFARFFLPYDRERP
ncbi:MAG: SRPBCC family protein [Pseudonocardia sp.]